MPNFIRYFSSAAVLAALLIAAPVKAQSDTDLADGSKSEQGLVIYSTNDPASWDPILQGFNKLYPWIKVQPVQLGGNEIWERYRAENASGVATADMFAGGSPQQFVVASDRGELLDYTPAGMDNLAVLEDVKVPGVITIGADPDTILFNKVALPKALWPTGFLDLAEKVKQNPALFAGKIATFDPVSSSVGPGFLIAREKGLGDKFWDAFQTLAPALKFEGGGGAMVDKVTAGQYLVAFDVLPLFTLRITGAKANITGWVYDDTGPLEARTISIAKTTKSPNSAKLLANYMVGLEGQQAFALGGSSPLHKDSQAQGAGLPYSQLRPLLKTYMVYGYGREFMTFNDTYAPRINKILGR